VVILSSLGAAGAFRALAAERGFACEDLATEKLPWERLEAVLVRRGNI
jgi:hypothetical protein